MRGKIFEARRYGVICWAVFDKETNDFVKRDFSHEELVFKSRKDARERAKELNEVFNAGVPPWPSPALKSSA
jgi:hypothetical protein